MNYKELKKFDLNEIKNKAEAQAWVEALLLNEKTDIIKYINFLRWQQFNGSISMKYLEKIIKILAYDGVMDFENENSNLITGETEDLVLLAEVEEVEEIENPVVIDGDTYSLKALLEDDFEKVMIVDDGEKLMKFGFIILSTLSGVEMYAYELYEESQDYYNEIIEAEIGTKVNVYSDVVGENQVVKTFRKVELLYGEQHFKFAKKSNKGVMSAVDGGSFQILKKEELISAEGISEDKLQSQLSKYQNEINKKLGIKMKDIHNAADKAKHEREFECVDPENMDCEKCESKSDCPTYKKPEKSKRDYEDTFKFKEKQYFTVSSPTEEEHINPLTDSILWYNGNKKDHNGLVEDAYVEEVYDMIFKVFGISEELEGMWSVPNSKLEKVIRKLIASNSEVDIDPTDASSFIERFLRTKKMERILAPKMNLKIIKILKTKKDLEEFAKDSGTELYIQIQQYITAVLEGTQRLYGENHIVFDSDYKLTICEYDTLDLYEASNYAIDNDYSDFYVVEKDKHTQYDAWYKEKLKNKINAEDIEEVVEEDSDETMEMITEIKEEYKESNGYDMGDEFIFTVYEELNASNTIEDPQFVVTINPLSYWKNEGCQYDQHLEHILCDKFKIIKDLGMGFEELMETTYAFSDGVNTRWTLTQIVDTLCKAGVKFDTTYQDFISSKDTNQVVAEINNLGHKSSII